MLKKLIVMISANVIRNYCYKRKKCNNCLFYEPRKNRRISCSLRLSDPEWWPIEEIIDTKDKWTRKN